MDNDSKIIFKEVYYKANKVKTINDIVNLNFINKLPIFYLNVSDLDTWSKKSKLHSEYLSIVNDIIGNDSFKKYKTIAFHPIVEICNGSTISLELKFEIVGYGRYSNNSISILDRKRYKTHNSELLTIDYVITDFDYNLLLKYLKLVNLTKMIIEEDGYEKDKQIVLNLKDI